MAYSQHTADRIQKEMEENFEGYFQSKMYEEVKGQVSEDDTRALVAAYTNAMYEKEDRAPKRWTRSATETVMTSVLPAEVSAAQANHIVPVLKSYFTYIEEAGYIKNGETLVKALTDFEADMLAKFGNAPVEKATETTVEVAETKATQAETTATTDVDSGWRQPVRRVDPEVQKLRQQMAEKQARNKLNKKLNKKKRKR